MAEIGKLSAGIIILSCDNLKFHPNRRCAMKYEDEIAHHSSFQADE
jgi:hypothetical protein